MGLGEGVWGRGQGACSLAPSPNPLRGIWLRQTGNFVTLFNIL
jgi:hypothetical protein